MRVLVVLLLLAAACGDTRPRPSPTPTATSTPAPTPTPTPRVTDPFALAATYEVGAPGELVELLSDDPEPVVEQSASRQLARKPEWTAEVLGALTEPLRSRVKANADAATELRILTAPREELPPWRIVAPPPAKELTAAYTKAERDFGIGWEYLAAIHLVETKMGRIRGDSTAGAKGPMQFLPSTWAAYGKGDINDPDDAIAAAARYLDANGGPQDMPQALFAYNHSDHYVRAVTIYAEQMRKDADAYGRYHAWQVYYRTTKGDALLYEGWPSK